MCPGTASLSRQCGCRLLVSLMFLKKVFVSAHVTSCCKQAEFTHLLPVTCIIFYRLCEQRPKAKIPLKKSSVVLIVFGSGSDTHKRNYSSGVTFSVWFCLSTFIVVVYINQCIDYFGLLFSFTISHEWVIEIQTFLSSHPIGIVQQAVALVANIEMLH